MRHIYAKSVPLMPVDNPEIGQKYHLSWARHHGMVWILKQINGGVVTLRTPRTNKILIAKLSDLRHTRSRQFKITQQLKQDERRESIPGDSKASQGERI